MVELLPSKQRTWVRFPSPAFWLAKISLFIADVAQLVERLHGKEKVRGSIPRIGLVSLRSNSESYRFSHLIFFKPFVIFAGYDC